MQLAFEKRGTALFAINADGIEHLARFVDDKHIVVTGEKDQRGCCYRIDHYGTQVLPVHEADIVIESGERRESVGHCTLPEASYQQSPHSDAVQALVKNIYAVQKQEPAPAAPQPASQPASAPVPQNPPRRSRGITKRPRHVGNEEHPNPCPVCGTPCYMGDCPNCN